MDHSAKQKTFFFTTSPKNLQKTPKLAIFGNFDPINPKSGENEMAYRIGYFAENQKYIYFFTQNVIFMSL